VEEVQNLAAAVAQHLLMVEVAEVHHYLAVAEEAPHYLQAMAASVKALAHSTVADIAELDTHQKEERTATEIHSLAAVPLVASVGWDVVGGRKLLGVAAREDRFADHRRSRCRLTVGSRRLAE
jgi:hypothetical protein